MQHINYRYSIVKTLDSFAECDSYIVKDAFDNRQYHATLINSAQHSFLSLIKRNYRMLLQLSHEFINPPFRFEKVFFCDDDSDEKRVLLLENLPATDALHSFCDKSTDETIHTLFAHLFLFTMNLEETGIYITHIPHHAITVKDTMPFFSNLPLWSNLYETPLSVYRSIADIIRTACANRSFAPSSPLNDLIHSLSALETREELDSLRNNLETVYHTPCFDAAPYSVGASADFDYVEKLFLHPSKNWGIIPCTSSTPITWLHNYIKQFETSESLFFTFMGSPGDMIFLEQLFLHLSIYFPQDIIQKYKTVLHFLTSDSVQFHLDRMTKIQLFESLSRIIRAFVTYYGSLTIYIVHYDNLDMFSRDFLVYITQDEYIKSLRILTATSYSDNLLYDLKEKGIVTEKLPIAFQLTETTVRRVIPYLCPRTAPDDDAVQFITSHVNSADEIAAFSHLMIEKHGLLTLSSHRLTYSPSKTSKFVSYTTERNEELLTLFASLSEQEKVNLIVLSLLHLPKPVAFLHNILPVAFIESMVAKKLINKDYGVYYITVPMLKDIISSQATEEMLRTAIEKYILIMIPYKDKRLSDLPELFALLFTLEDPRPLFEELLGDIVRHKYYSYEPRKYELMFNLITEKIIEFELPYTNTENLLDLLERFGFGEQITRLVFYANSIASTAQEKVRTLFGIAETFALEQNEKSADNYIADAFKNIPALDPKSRTTALLHYNKVLQTLKRYEAIIDNSVVIISELWENLSIIKKLDLLISLGNAYFRSGNVEDAQIQFEHTMSLIEKNINLVPLYMQSTAINNLGVIYSKLGMYDKAHANYKRAIALYQNFSDIYGLTTTYNNLASLSLKINPFDSIIYSYAMKALSYARKTGTLPNIILGYSSLISYYFNKGYLYKIEEIIHTNLAQLLNTAMETENTDELISLLSALINFYLFIGDFESAQTHITAIHTTIDKNALTQNKYIADIVTLKYLFELAEYQKLLDEWEILSEKYEKPAISDRIIIDIFYFSFLSAIITGDTDTISRIQYLLRTNYSEFFSLPFYEKKYLFMLSVKKYEFNEVVFALLRYLFTSTESNKNYELTALIELARRHQNTDYLKELYCEMLLYHDFIASNLSEPFTRFLTKKPILRDTLNYIKDTYSLPVPTLDALRSSINHTYLENSDKFDKKTPWDFIAVVLNIDNDYESLCNYIIQRFEAFRVIIFNVSAKKQLTPVFTIKKKPYYADDEEVDDEALARAIQSGDIVFRDLTQNFTCLYTNGVKYSVAMPIIDIERVEIDTKLKRRKSDVSQKMKKVPSKIIYFDTKRFISPIPFYSRFQFSGLQEVLSLYNHYSLIKRNALLCPTSGIYNFYYWHLLLTKLLAEEHAPDEISLIVIIDVLNYKDICAIYGSDTDRRFIKYFTSALEHIVRKDDMIGKHSRHSFIVNLLLNTDAKPEDVMARIKHTVEEYDFPELTVQVKIALGGALYPEHGMSSSALIENTETALLEAKKTDSRCMLWNKNMKRVVMNSPLPVSVDKMYLQSTAVLELINMTIVNHFELCSAVAEALMRSINFSSLYVKVAEQEIKFGDTLWIDSIIASHKDGLYFYQDEHYIVQFFDDTMHLLLLSEKEITIDDYYILKSIYELMKMKLLEFNR